VLLDSKNDGSGSSESLKEVRAKELPSENKIAEGGLSNILN